MSSKQTDEKKLPRWLIRRWRLLKAAIASDEFQKLLPDMATEFQANGNMPTEHTFATFKAFNIPGDCVNAIYALLENPDLLNKEHELIHRIQPPIQYWSFRAKQLGPSDDPAKNFEVWQRHRKRLIEEKGVDLLEEHEGLLLEVSSYTTKEELMGFIDEYFDSHLKPLLQDSEGYFTPQELRKGRIREPSRLKERILALHKAGKTPKEIEEVLGYRHWASNISRIISESEKPPKKM